MVLAHSTCPASIGLQHSGVTILFQLELSAIGWCHFSAHLPIPPPVYFVSRCIQLSILRRNSLKFMCQLYIKVFAFLQEYNKNKTCKINNVIVFTFSLQCGIQISWPACDESIVVDSHKLVVQLRPHLTSRISWLPAPTVEMISWEKKFLISSSQ